MTEQSYTINDLRAHLAARHGFTCESCKELEALLLDFMAQGRAAKQVLSFDSGGWDGSVRQCLADLGEIPAPEVDMVFTKWVEDLAALGYGKALVARWVERGEMWVQAAALTAKELGEQGGPDLL